MKIINQKGFSLLEIKLVLGIGTAMAFMKFQDMKKDQEAVMANTVGAQMKQMGEAVNRYISIRYDKLSTLSSSSSQTSDLGPRTCSANGCEITYQTLINEGLLPVSYTGINAQKSSYTILLKRSGIAPNYVINGLVTTTQPWSEGNKIRYDLLGRAMQVAGIDSAMTQSATVASGMGGQWTESQSSYAGINAAGLLAYRVGYDSSMYSVYLRRDGTLPMTGDLNMGGQNIYNAQNITAAGITTSEALKSMGETQVGTTITVGGNANIGGDITASGNIFSTHTITANGSISTGDSLYARNSIYTGSESSTKAYMNKDGNIYGSGNAQLDGNINANGNINSYSQITASQRLTTGEFLQINGVANVGWGCSPNGLQGRAVNGNILSCVDGVWTGNEGNTIVSSGNINNNTSFICRSGASGKILVQAYFNWVVYYAVYQMTANLYANGLLVESDKTAAFEYDHGRASGSSVTLFHTAETPSGSDYIFSVAATSDNLVKVSYSCVGV
ncbi:shufflon system plasmid conjugative transfer pilus tip adhesin PilV [Dickeya solani]|uniref:Shufflon system plasmid conjugative transfer pilus tip adhesin PilV n=1 Tax=Dickeya solani TaxID=1089444 RepID=A0ABU4EFR5_9GAMM|nr:shufflon system plasmid conjugative transfer pilus tip adhesin PilV [Dickeya solani]MCA7000042.1 shufflon system plasmid conjugative transfer pilus tip adhesin PilV [Dickeya solani]MCZ0821351.1 shufflon system plasmid conjugative transfer pilus tip adhesin PilV [Dickeya solani]MDV6995337.1 shufflon system plasmid conjugative transfer pilus tip adhesin PilV [Dickeya solani]MDV7004959.1 shufflon system plasmid conjugative transfer pilus tip adhesin PilV [Dickeya solani]MDV7040063.1 shufflon s